MIAAALLWAGALLAAAPGDPLDLPDPLLSLDGTRVTDVRAWNDKRRPEILRLYERHVFGRTPAPPAPIQFETVSEKRDALGGLARRKIVRLYLHGRRDGPWADLLLYVPAAAAGPAPAFLGMNYLGNQSVTAEPDIPITPAWIVSFAGATGIVKGRATEASRAAQARRWPLETILRRGYAVATLCYAEVEPDRPDGWKTSGRLESDWGAIGVWAFGLSRALDYLERDPAIDARRVAVTGHSRLGKTALWAAAQDRRFALVVSNDSGEGGAALARRKSGERIADSIRMTGYWYTAKYREYVDREEALPVDAHFLISLAAPRPVYITSATEDAWADPEGEFLAARHAGPVYRLFGKPGLGAERQPEPDRSVGGHIGYHVRTGKHDILAADWAHHLDFADRHLKAAQAPSAVQELLGRLDESGCRRLAAAGVRLEDLKPDGDELARAFLRPLASPAARQEDLARLRAAADELMKNRVALLGYPAEDLGDPYDWFRAPKDDQQWPTHLSRHYYLAPLALLYAATGEEKYAAHAAKALTDWVRRFPLGAEGLQWRWKTPPGGPHEPRGEGLMRGYVDGAWTSLSAEARTHSWLSLLPPLAGSRAMTNQTAALLLNSLLGSHRRLMLDFPRRGTANQFLALGAALLELGKALPDFQGAAECRAAGRERMLEFANVQVYPDGSVAECSPNYGLGSVARLHKVMRDLPELGERVRAALRYYAFISDPFGRSPRIAKGGGQILRTLETLNEGVRDPEVEWVASRGAHGSRPARRLEPEHHRHRAHRHAACAEHADSRRRQSAQQHRPERGNLRRPQPQRSDQPLVLIPRSSRCPPPSPWAT